MNTATIDQVTIFKCIGDDVRLSIIKKLLSEKCELSSHGIVASCAEVFHLSQPAMSHHFNKLIQAGIINERKVGVEKFYTLDVTVLQAAGIDIETL